MTVKELMKELPDTIVNVRVDFRDGELCEVVKVNKKEIKLIG